jgi:recombination protein RecT
MATKAKTKNDNDNQQQLPVPKARAQVDAIREELNLRAGMMRSQLPAHITMEQVRDGVIKAISFNPKLLECSRHSIVNSALEAAELGLSVSPTLKLADILPVWSPNGSVAQFRPRYQGYMKLARQSGEIADIYAHVVREGDDFDYALGLDKKLRHVPKVSGKGEIIAAYCVWVGKDGTKSFDVMSRDELDNIRDRSEGYKAFLAKRIKSTPWESDHAEMCRKSAVRRASKYMPMSTDPFLKAMALDEARETGQTARMVDGDVVIEPTGSFDVTDTGQQAPAEPKGSKNLDALEAKVAGGGKQAPQQQTEGPHEVDGDPGPGGSTIEAQAEDVTEPAKQDKKAAAPTDKKPAATKQAAGKPMPMPMADGQPDWEAWFTNACAEVKKLAPADVSTWEQANDKNIGMLGFYDQQKAEDFRAFVEERAAG